MKNDDEPAHMLESGTIDETFEQYIIHERYRGGLARYVINGIRPGSFLCAVISNNLREALGRVDNDVTIEQVRQITLWFYNECPTQCHGDADAMENWIRTKTRERDRQIKP